MGSSDLEAVGAAPHDLIAQKSRDHIGAYLETRDRWNAASSLKALTDAAAREYEDRFLIELIQNGYDAHLAEKRDGRIVIRLARDEGEHGTIYVANGGTPFTESNFNALCEIAQSDKKPGESVGHKGVGFTSVLQVCAWPEIYSGDEAQRLSGSLGGFCFGFAKPEDVLKLTEGDETAAQAVVHDISPYFLPIPLEHKPQAVHQLAKEGLATVVRLPLESEVALQVAEEQIRFLRQSKAPLMLFLERLNRLDIVTTGGGLPSEMTALTRRAEQLRPQPSLGGGRLELVDLGHQGRWLLASRAVDEARLKKALAESVDSGQIDEAWTDWTAPAVVSVATRSDADEVDPQMYTFLPMGKHAPAPFWGHLNAPFSTKLARLDINDRVPLNALFLDAGAELCADAVLTARHAPEAIPETAAADFLAWDEPHVQRLTTAFERRGISVESSEILPVETLGDGTRWASLGNAYAWADSEYKSFTREALVEAAEVAVVRASLGTARIERLDRFCKRFNAQGLEPRPSTLANWAEALAARLAARRFAPRSWDAYYDELALLFESNADALDGKRILLDDELRLHAPADTGRDSGETSKVLVFFPPARERTDDEDEIDPDADVKPPASLKRHLVSINDRLIWTVRDGSRLKQKPSRQFLEKHRLVRRFRTRDLLEHTGATLRRTKSARTFADALRFAYALVQASGVPQGIDLSSLNFRVPTNQGWTLAREAAFSRMWSNSRGATLEQLIQRTRTVSADLAALEGRLLLPADEWPFAVRDESAWLAFLRLIGVGDGLAPARPYPPNTQSDGRFIRPDSLARRLRLSEQDAEAWEAEVHQRTQAPLPEHPQTPYRARHGIFVLPGQREFGDFDEQARFLFAELLFAGLAVWPAHVLEVEFFRPRHSSKPDQRLWPSPVAAFLARASWIPVTSQREAPRTDFVPPAAAWHLGDGEEGPRYAPLLAQPLRHALEGAPRALDRLRTLGLKTWSGPDDAPALIRKLGEIAAADVLAESDLLSFKRTYRTAWRDVVQQELGNPFEVEAPDQWLPVMRAGRVDAVPTNTGTDGAPIYVTGRTAGLPGRLLEAIGQATVQVDDTITHAVASLLRERFGDQIREASAVEVSIEMDGSPFTPTDGGVPLVTQDRDWLVLLIALALEFRGGRFDRRGERGQRVALDRLRQIRIWAAEEVTVTIDGKPVALPPALSRAIPVEDADFPAIAVRAPALNLSWPFLEHIMPSVAELIRAPDLADSLAFAMVQLERQAASPDVAPPSDEAFAAAFAVTTEQIVEVRRSTSGRIEVALERLIPVLECLVGDDASDALLAVRTQDVSEEKLVEILAPWANQLPLPPSALVAQCADAANLGHIRDVLGLDYAAFNAALHRLPAPYEAIHNNDGHEQAMEWFKRSNYERILRVVRARFLHQFDRRQPLAEYVQARALRDLRPDETWLDLCSLPTEEMIERRLADWLTGVGAAPAPGIEEALESLDTVRAANTELCRAAARAAATAVVAWCAKNHAALPALWEPGESPGDSVPEQLDADGLLDFRRLRDADVVDWLTDHAHWPAAMPRSLTANQLGLTDADLRAGQQQEEEAKRRRDIARRSITLDGTTYSADPSSLRDLAEAARSTMTEAFLQSSAKFTKLEEVRGLQVPRGRRGAGGRVTPDRRASDAQRAAIGLVGEVAAHEWLKRHYGPQVAGSCWRSGYRNVVLGGNLGDDNLGFDFEIVLRTKTNLYEVKSTPTEELQIELGESQVNVARLYAGSRRFDYRILFVMNVLDSSRRSIHVLPNPFSPRHREFFRLVGTGLTYRFELA